MSSKLQLSLQKIELAGRDSEPFGFMGAPLGVGSSRRDTHLHDRERERYAPKGTRCSACRWFEVAIYRRFTAEEIDLSTTPPKLRTIEPEAVDYVIHTVGASAVPGEQRLSRIEVTDSAFEVVELLTVRREGDSPWIPAQSSRALARAAELDDGLHEAYVNRAVV